MKLKPSNGETVSIIISAIMTVLFTAAVAVAVVFSVMLSNSEAKLNKLKESSEMDIASLEGEKNDISSHADELSENLSNIKKEYESVKSEADSLREEIKIIQEESGSSDRKYAELSSALDEKQAVINKLEENIAKLENVYSVDINAQFDVLAKLSELLETGAPEIEVKKTVTDDNGETTEITEKVYPTISLYYEDIEHGYIYSYNENYTYYSASCLKAPFALSILENASNEVNTLQQKIDELNNRLIEQAIEEGKSEEDVELYTLTNLPEGMERVFDFDKIFTYTEDKAQNGSGKIKDDEDGTEYTYLQLIEYMLRYSDNVAYNELKKEYGTAYFSELAYRLKTTALKRNLSNMTAADGGKVMKAIYEYIKSENVYSDFLYECMTTSAHSVMIPYAVSPSKAAHKYGWDVESYHDMAIVFDEHPYVVVFMSNMDTGGDEVNDYIRSVIKLVNALHKNFYKKSK